MKALKNILLITLPSILILFFILEIFFRVVIPADNPPRSVFDENEKMYFFSDKKKEGISTRGRFAEIKAKWHINNMHWNSPFDYENNPDNKLIAVIGDSYVQAFQVDVDKNFSVLLGEKLNDIYKVYSFGLDGAPLSQYLHQSRYVSRHFDPEILIFNLVHNDFDESIVQLYPLNQYMLRVSVSDDGTIKEIAPQPDKSLAQYKVWKRVIYRSALFRYLYLNLHIKEMRHKVLTSKESGYEGNIKIDDLHVNKALIFKATSYLVKTICKENPDKRIIFLMDAPRDNIYKNTLNDSKLLWVNEMVRALCVENGIELIDLTEKMAEDYKKNRKEFNFKIDGHWNEYGHQFVANLLFEYLSKTKN